MPKMKELKNFIRLSKYAGERFDLIQAGGGNSSVKLAGGIMLVKASGFMLSEVELDKGYVKVGNKEVVSILENKKLLSLKNKKKREGLAWKLLKGAVVSGGNRPSIETYLHALLYKYTLHTHPLIVSALVSRKDCGKILNALFNDRVAFVGYKSPGLELGWELKDTIQVYQERFLEKPKIIFLANHGLITSSDCFSEVVKITEEILKKIEGYLRINLEKYKMTNRISSLINSIENSYRVSYLSCDIQLNRLIRSKRNLFFKPPFSPDGLVYGGPRVLEIGNLEDKKPVMKYFKIYSEYPKVLIFRDKIFFIAKNLKKAKEIEDVFKAHVLTLNIQKSKVSFLKDAELHYLGNWEAERYRQKFEA